MKNKKAGNKIKISHLISLPTCTLYILSSIIFYGVLKTDMPLVLYGIFTFFMGVSVIFSFYEFEFDKDIDPQKNWFYSNAITYHLPIKKQIQILKTTKKKEITIGMSKSKFSLVLRQHRENAGLTQKQVAEALKVERSTYAYYETGVTQPSCAFVIEVSKIFGIDYKILMEAIIDMDFNEDFTTLTSDSWQKREKMYTLKKDEQNIILAYRAISAEDKEKISDELNAMLNRNAG